MNDGNDRADATIANVAAHFGVSVRTVKRWLANTDIPHRRATESGAIRFNLSEVDQWAARGGQPSDGEPVEKGAA